MKSIFDTNVYTELETRINALNENYTAQWGKMNAYQMVKHCSLCEDMMQGRIQIKRVFMGRLFGKLILNKIIKDEKPFGKNSPTGPILITLNQSGDIETQKQEWIAKIKDYENFSNHNFVHPFFGAMTKEQIGIFAYKHTDHHLRQFGV